MAVRRPDGSVDIRRAPGLDEDTLRQIADATGGRYFRARDTEGLRAVYEEISSLERTELRAPEWTSWTDQGPRLSAWAAVLVFASLVLRSTRVSHRSMKSRFPAPGAAFRRLAAPCPQSVG